MTFSVESTVGRHGDGIKSQLHHRNGVQVQSSINSLIGIWNVHVYVVNSPGFYLRAATLENHITSNVSVHTLWFYR